MSKSSETHKRPLREKLGLKPDTATLLLNVPGNMLRHLIPLPETTHVKVSKSANYAFVLAFVETPDQLSVLFDQIKEHAEKTGCVWVAWQKKRKGFKPLFGFTEVQQAGLQAGLVDVKVCSVSDVWSGLKFMYRAKDW